MINVFSQVLLAHTKDKLLDPEAAWQAASGASELRASAQEPASKVA